MTRVVAGVAKGRHLEVPPSGTRPTSDRIREALFSSLEHHLGSFATLEVLDLFAGSGALGLEALSRGARRVMLVEKDRRAVEVIRRNIAKVDMPGASVAQDDATQIVALAPLRGTYDVVFMDPPYSMTDAQVESVIAGLSSQGWLNDEATLVVERSKDSRLKFGPGWEVLGEREYGGTQLVTAVWYGQARA